MNAQLRLISIIMTAQWSASIYSNSNFEGKSAKNRQQTDQFLGSIYLHLTNFDHFRTGAILVFPRPKLTFVTCIDIDGNYFLLFVQEIKCAVSFWFFFRFYFDKTHPNNSPCQIKQQKKTTALLTLLYS